MALALVLHAHLPYVRDTGPTPSLEERWLHDAIVDTYLPLAGLLERVRRRARTPLLALSLSPTLVSMLRDDRHRVGFLVHVEERLGLVRRLRGDAGHRALEGALAHHEARLSAARDDFERRGRDVVGAFVDLARAGAIELFTTAATHGYLPGLRPASRRAQIRLARRHHAEIAGQPPLGFWLPECGFDAAIDDDLARAGVGYAFLESHGVELARPRPPFGTATPVLAPSGVAYLGRDPELARIVWSREVGYPGDAAYREFHRDVGYEASEALLGDALVAGQRAATGIKPWAVTGSETKRPYDPAAGLARARQHAEAFVRVVAEREAAQPVPGGPLSVAPFDAELFGHFWHEGPAFLERVLELATAPGAPIRVTTPTTWLRAADALPVAQPSPSSWGDGGFGEVWTHPSTAHLTRLAHQAERDVLEIDGRVRDRPSSPLARRARLAALRELLLLEASDWAFMVRLGDYGSYGERRARQHAAAVGALVQVVARDGAGANDEALVATCERKSRVLAALEDDSFADALDPW